MWVLTISAKPDELELELVLDEVDEAPPRLPLVVAPAVLDVPVLDPPEEAEVELDADPAEIASPGATSSSETIVPVAGA